MNNLVKTLNLSVPLVVFDLETTAVNLDEARIVEMYLYKLNLDGSREEFYSLVNPGHKIPSDAIEIHGITDDMVLDKPYFASIGKQVLEFIGNAALLGFNSNQYDLPILAKEFGMMGILFDFINRIKLDARIIHQKFNPSNLSTLYNKYTGKVLENAHSADADTLATLEIFEKQVELYKDQFPENLDKLCSYREHESKNRSVDLAGKFIIRNGVVYYNFGKNKGIPALDDKAYLNWILHSSDMRADAKLVAKLLLDGKKFE
jgi:DNA polymerase-3 subunit epsilon